MACGGGDFGGGVVVVEVLMQAKSDSSVSRCRVIGSARQPRKAASMRSGGDKATTIHKH